jgi:hypothetical protein
MIDAVEDQGAGRFVYTNRKLFRKFKSVLVAAASAVSLSEIGSNVFKYEDVEIIVGGKNENGKDLLDFTEAKGTDPKTASMYCFAPGTSEDFTGVQVLMASNSIEVIQEGIRDSQHVDTIEVAFGVAKYHPRAAARLQGVKIPT